MSEPVIHVAGLCGSLRPESYTRMALEIALRGAQEGGAVTRMIDLRDYDLVFSRGKDNEVQYPEAVLRLRAAVRDAHGIILATPEYHGSFSGVLKNALDLMGFDEFEGKMLGLVGVSGGALGAFDALNTLRHVGRALHAWVVPAQASVPEAWKVFDQSGKLLDPRYEERLLEVGREVTRFARLHACEQALDFLRSWEKAHENPGGA